MRNILLFMVFYCLVHIRCTPADERSTTHEAQVISHQKTEIADTLVGISRGISVPEKLWSPPDGWSEVAESDTFGLDLKYAGKDNFVQTQLYECPRCFVKEVIHEKLLLIRAELSFKGLMLKFFDCYRPLSVQKRLWEKKPDATYVTDPAKGSMHNRGLAVDVTLAKKNGEALDMGTDYDYFGRAAHQDYFEHPQHILENRKILRDVMEKHGFNVIRTEWWHYSYFMANQPVEDWTWPCHENNQ